MRRAARGFTLVEISLALVALGVLLLGGLGFWQHSASSQVAAAQQEAQGVVRDALLGFLHANHRLPCPAVDALGKENCDAARQVGFVPWKTLALPQPQAGQLRYGVYREAAGSAGPEDRDLARARDRMDPLRIATPSPKPRNGNAPNADAPPWPVASTALLGATQSGNALAPLDSACDAARSPPCPPGTAGAGTAAAVNAIDVCLALHTASSPTPAAPAQLAVQAGGQRYAMAFVVAAPGLLDADGDGSAFDGANATVSNDNPTFESAARIRSDVYDDQVVAVSAAELFSSLACTTGLAAAAHSHFAAANGAFVFERALYDYRDQLYISVKLAEADVAAAAAGMASAAAGVADGAQAMSAAVADSVSSMGARSAQIGLAAAGIAAAAAGVVAAALGVDDAAASLADAKETHKNFAERSAAATELSRSLNHNALLADAIGF